jgi:hypothetical protein
VVRRAFAELGILDGEIPVVAQLHEGERVGTFAHLEADECLLAVGRGGAEDLDIAVFNDDGAILAFDEEPDAKPATLYCASAPERVYVALTASANRAVSRQAVGTNPPALAGLGLARVRGGDAQKLRRRLEKPARAARKSRMDARIDGLLVRREQELGVHLRELRRVDVPLDPTAATAIGVAVEAAQCIDLALLGDDFGAIDGEVRGADDRLLTRFDEREKRRTAVVCAGDRPRSLTVTLRPHLGQGSVPLLVSGAPRSAFEQLPASGAFDFGVGLSVKNPGETTVGPRALAAGERWIRDGYGEGCRSVGAVAADGGFLRIAARTAPVEGGSPSEPIHEASGEGVVSIAFCGAGRIVVDAPLAHNAVQLVEAPRPAAFAALAAPVAARLLARIEARDAGAATTWTFARVEGTPKGAIDREIPLAADRCVQFAATRLDDTRGGVALESALVEVGPPSLATPLPGNLLAVANGRTLRGGAVGDRNSGARSAALRVCTAVATTVVFSLRADGPVETTWAEVPR